MTILFLVGVVLGAPLGWWARNALVSWRERKLVRDSEKWADDFFRRSLARAADARAAGIGIGGMPLPEGFPVGRTPSGVSLFVGPNGDVIECKCDVCAKRAAENPRN